MRRMGLTSGAAIVLLISAVACFSQQHNNAEAASSGQASAASSGAARSSKGSAVQASWSSSHTEPINDPGLGEEAFTAQVPNGWKFVGTILRPSYCHGPVLPADGLSWTALSPDGVTAGGQMPGSAWKWSSDGGDLGQKKCGTLDIHTANAFLLNIAIPNIRPAARNIKLQALNAGELKIMEQKREEPPIQHMGMVTRNMVDFGRVLLEYTDPSGNDIDEQLGVILTCSETQMPAAPMMHRQATTQRDCMTHGTIFAHAPHGHLQEALAHRVPFPKINQKWDSDVVERMRTAFAQIQKLSDDTWRRNSEIAQKQEDQILANGRAAQASLRRQGEDVIAADRAAQEATDHAAQQQVRASLERQDFIDPNTGQKIVTSNQYNHNWIGSNGTVVLNSDTTYNPNGSVNPVSESFTEMVPVN